MIAALGFLPPAQTPASTILTVEMENVVQYQENFANLAKNGTSTVMEPPIGPPSRFSPGYFIGDIATINGKKSKGTTFARNLFVNFSPNPSGSQAVADISRFQAMEILLEIQQADGTRGRNHRPDRSDGRGTSFGRTKIGANRKFRGDRGDWRLPWRAGSGGDDQQLFPRHLHTSRTPSIAARFRRAFGSW